MKQITISLFISLTCLMAQQAKAQLIVDSVNIDKLDIEYIKLTGCDIFNGFSRQSSQASVWIDFGQGNDQRAIKEFLKPNESVRFRSTVEALNYCYKNGWEVIQQYVPVSSSTCHNYLLKRRNRSTK